MTTNKAWIKSSRSAQQGNCVEVAGGFDMIRDSKDPERSRLQVDARALIRAVKDGRFD